MDKARARVAESRGVQVVMHYHPFMIDPRTKPNGEEYQAYNERRWGGDGWTRSMRALGRKEGANYANWKTWPNTTHASRMLLHAEKHGLADKLVGVLYEYCYELGENVSLRETVARAAEQAGVPEAAEYAQSDEGSRELAERLSRAKTADGKRVSAAPTFSVSAAGASYSFSGAQDTDHWVELLEHCADLVAEATGP